MDDGGQRLLDVIEDPHVLETLLRESFSTSALEDSSRFDNVSSSTDSGLVSSGLDNLIFDGQLVDPFRGGPSHSSHHAHTVTPHVLQQVLHSPNLSAASLLSGGNSHQLHHHQIHHQSQQVQAPLLSQPQHTQQSNSQNQNSLAGDLENDCPARNRESCARNDSDHQALQQLLASSPLNTSQQILQLHHSHLQPQNSQAQSNISPAQLQQHGTSLQNHSQPQSSTASHITSLASHLVQASPVPPQHQSLPPPLSLPTTPVTSSQVNSRSSLLQPQHSPQQQQHNHHHPHAQQARPQQSQHSSKTQNPSQSQIHSNSEIPGGLLSVGLPANVGRSNMRLNSIQASPIQSQTPHTPVSALESSNKTATITSPSCKIISTPSSIQSSVIHSGVHNVSGRVQLVGGTNPVLPSGAQILASASQILPGATQILQSGSTHVLPGGAIFSAPNVIPGGQVLSNVQSGQVFQGGQLIPGAQVLANHLLNTSQLSTIGGIGSSPATTLCVAPPVTTHIQPSLSLVSHNSVLSSIQSSSASSSITSHLSSVPSTSGSLSSSTFQLPNKSPVSLPRTSPVPYSATPSPHQTAPSPSYPTRSPAPSPHNIPGNMRSPAPLNPSPTITSSHASNLLSSSVSTSGANFVSSMVGGVNMVQGLVSHLPLPSVGGTNGVVLTQGGSPIQVPSGLKQMMPGGQLIQLVSSPQSTQVRQPIIHQLHKPIQPKQPQLLPKPTTQAIVRQPTPPPPGKTLVGSRSNTPCTQQPIVIGNGSNTPTVITGQPNLGSFVLNSSLLPGLQQPLLIPQPNGMQLLVRPTAAPSVAASQGQTLLLPVPSQSQGVASLGKVSAQPQTLVIPGSGQTPALVIPQGLAPALGSSNVFGANHGARQAQPILRLLTPQAPLQLQQINTPTGPTFVALPVGQTINLPGMFATPSGTVRTLAPQVAPGTLHLAPASINPPAVGLNSIQIPGGSIQVSSSPSLHLTLSNSLPTIINTTASTSRVVTEENALSSTTTTSTHVPIPVPSHHIVNEKPPKKKSKKKKKEKDSKDDKKGKGVSINLNELLKESGIVSEMIFEDGEFGDLGMESSEAMMVQTSDNISAPSTNAVAGMANSITPCTISPPLIAQPAKTSIPPLTVLQGQTLNVPSNQSQSNVISSLPTSMCLTLDANGKFVLGSADAAKSIIPAVPSSGSTPVIAPQIGTPIQLLTTGSIANTSTSAFIFTNPESTLPTPVSSTAPLNQLVTLHSQSDGSPILKIDMPSQIVSKSLPPKNHLSNEITKVAQNTQLLHTLQPDKLQLPNASIINNVLIPPAVSHAANITSLLPTTGSVINSSDRGGRSLITEVIKFPDQPASNPLVPTTCVAAQLPHSSSAVIVSANLPTSILPVSKSANQPQSFEVVQSSSGTLGNINYNLTKRENSNTVPISMQILENPVKNNSYQNQYLATVKNHTIMESCKSKKSNKKKRRDKETVEIKAHVNHVDQFIEKNNNISISNPITTSLQYNNSQVILTNGNNGTLVGASNATKMDIEAIKVEEPLIVNSSHPSPFGPINLNPQLTSVTSCPVVPVVTSCSASAVSNLISLTSSTVSSPISISKSLSPNTHSTLPPSNTIPSGFVFTGQQVLLQPGQQVKQLIITSQNQEALKRVQTQIHSLQSKKGPVTEQDKLLHQKLLSEQKKIVATGKPVAISPSTLSQTQPAPMALQRSPVKYSHAVGHKKIFFSPPATQKRNSQATVSKDLKQDSNKDQKLKNIDIGRFSEAATSHSSSHISPAITSFASMTTTITTTSPSLTTHISNVSLTSSNSQQFTPITRTTDCMKKLDLENHQVGPNVTAGPVNIPDGPRGHPASTVPGANNSSSSSGNYASVSIIFTSPKSVVPASVSPKFVVSQQFSGISTSSSVSSQTNLPTGHHPQGSQASTIVISPCQSTSQTVVPVSQISPRSFSLPLTRDQLFEHQLRTDQNGALNPDFRAPFKNKIDGCKRLIRYHVFNDSGPGQSEIMESDSQFELQSENLMKKFNVMLHKYKSLLLKESMHRHSSSESVMLYRLFNQEEKSNFEREKVDLKAGKEMSFTNNPSNWITNEDPLPDYSFPWEENWPSEKLFVVDRDTQILEEIGVERDESSEERESIVSDQNDQSDDKPLTDWEEIDEPRLQIMEDDLEADDSKLSSEESRSCEQQNEKFNDNSSTKLFSSCDSDSVQSPSVDLELTSNDSLSDRNYKSEIVKLNSSIYTNSKENKGYHPPHWPLNNEVKSNTAACLSPFNCDVKTNGIDKTHKTQNSLSFGSHSEFFIEANKKFNNVGDHHKDNFEYHSNSFRTNHRTDKNKRDKKYRTDKERRKHDRMKDKSRIRDKDINKLSKKLKIKLKSGDQANDQAIVPPLRIRTDERGSGKLKLTLKKQEGSSDYYRVGEELREYKVKHNAENSTTAVPFPNKFLPHSKIQHDHFPDAQSLQKVSVVLQNCLQTEWKSKREHEDSIPMKKSKRLKSIGGQSTFPSLTDKYDFNPASPEKEVTLPHWSTNERWKIQSGNSPASSSSPPISSNSFFHHSSRLPPDRMNPNQNNFIPYSQPQPHKNSQLS